MVDLSQLKKGKHIRTTNGNICKVLSVKNSGDVYFIVTENVQKTSNLTTTPTVSEQNELNPFSLSL